MEAIMIPKEIQDLVKYTGSRLPLGTYGKYSFDTWKWYGKSKNGLIPDESIELWRALGQWRNAVFPSLVFHGDFGTGKTHLATAIGWQKLIGEQQQVIFYEVADLLDDLTDFEYDSKKPHRVIRDVKNSGLLILDDMGIHKGTEFARSRLDNIINHRYIEQKETIITVNSLEISERMTERILDRCRDGIIVQVKGQSHRGIWKVKEGK
jgi:DNA replication protein DnaC